ncbi:KDO2-lipid IV(A) lauroyltransferase [Branchiibius hedensis]|uniref:KDO2-lipid IV(A) lauroyltransferase n=1 Tax=Branchiibius hedensis TaxID=672460 RepID=A0A2Y8ZMY9_9MICO|nr:phosphatidylinositol mannoside acyltransferase [Branchiibius hedensis]PWJ24965.1 KDO2-lipid IV(A) lauroyltransferase [Branchiibius hedensis]SSA33781.1 KDO2-lipid IV(A) lauroyltransferase [Branchiibius hedensis]
MSRRSELTGAATVAGYRAGWGLVRRLPERSAYAAFQVIADRAYARGGKSVQRLRSNYARVRPELDEPALEALVKEGMRSYLRYFCDAFRLQLQNRESLDGIVELEDHGDDIRAQVGAGKPLVGFLGHMGNWDLTGAWATYHFAKVTTIAERLKPEELFEEFLEFRESLGMTIVPLTGGSAPYAAMRDALNEGGFVPLLADRDLTSHGVEVQLCGHRAKVAAGPARLALETGAALHTIAIRYRPLPGRAMQGITAHIGPRVPVPDGVDDTEKVRLMTQACIDVLGEQIRLHTADWHMMQRVFLDDLDPARTRDAR